KNEQGKNFTGSSAAFDPKNPLQSLRLDPEGVRVGGSRNIFISDEYGPSIYEFDSLTGTRRRTLTVPRKFRIDNPNADGKKELPPANTSGRQSNRGMEGLAISPDGQLLVGIMQSPLIQDNGLNEENKRVGLNIRILVINLSTSQRKEFLYQ